LDWARPRKDVEFWIGEGYIDLPKGYERMTLKTATGVEMPIILSPPMVKRTKSLLKQGFSEEALLRALQRKAMRQKNPNSPMNTNSASGSGEIVWPTDEWEPGSLTRPTMTIRDFRPGNVGQPRNTHPKALRRIKSPLVTRELSEEDADTTQEDNEDRTQEDDGDARDFEVQPSLRRLQERMRAAARQLRASMKSVKRY
jgi:hypothetical protein